MKARYRMSDVGSAPGPFDVGGTRRPWFVDRRSLSPGSQAHAPVAQRRFGVLAAFMLGCISAVVMTAPAGAAAADLPRVIKIGGVAVSGTTQGTWGAIGVARSKGWFDEEFAKDGITVEFPGFNGGGAMVGQALANGQIDFAASGDMISLIGKSAGVRSKVVAATSHCENAYVLVKPDSPIQKVSDLRGRNVGYWKGNYITLQAIRIMAAAGIGEHDVRSVSVNWTTGPAALASGDIEALFEGSEALRLKSQGAGRIIFSTQGESIKLTSQAGLVVNEDFAAKYPEATKRVLKVFARAAHWASQEANREAVYVVWAGDGLRDLATLRGDYGGRPMADMMTPLLDPFFVSQYKNTQDLLVSLGLLRGGKVDIDTWFDSSYLTAAIRELDLQKDFVALDVNGVRIAPAQVAKQTVPLPAR